MPLHYIHDLKKRRFLVTLSGAVTLDELATFIAEQITRGFWQTAVLYDATSPGVTLLSLGNTPMGVWHELTDEHGRRGVVAFAVADDGQRAIATAYVDAALAADLFTGAVFSEVSSAETWLDQQGATSATP